MKIRPNNGFEKKMQSDTSINITSSVTCTKNKRGSSVRRELNEKENMKINLIAQICYQGTQILFVQMLQTLHPLKSQNTE